MPPVREPKSHSSPICGYCLDREHISDESEGGKTRSDTFNRVKTDGRTDIPWPCFADECQLLRRLRPIPWMLVVWPNNLHGSDDVGGGGGVQHKLDVSHGKK